MSIVRIGVCQVFLADGDRAGNFARIERGICEAKAAGAEIACLPEMAVLGWVNPDAHERGCAIPGADSDRFCGLAEKYGIFVCVGLGEKDGSALYDSAVLIDDMGEILLKHRKINLLAELMDPAYTAGTEGGGGGTRVGGVGLRVCVGTHGGGGLVVACRGGVARGIGQRARIGLIEGRVGIDEVRKPLCPVGQ